MKTIYWDKNAVVLIDQTKLPGKLTLIRCKTVKRLWKAIRSLEVRGAPALGAAGALGVYLGIKDSGTLDYPGFIREVRLAAAYLDSSRPTARNLSWGTERVRCVAQKYANTPVKVIKQQMLKEALRIINEDQTSCRAMGYFGSKIIKPGMRILTICNTGALATIDYGTAFGVIARAHEEGKRIHVYACETRPLLQGARLTAWELKRKKIPYTLITDSMSATLMRQGKVDLVITGADRIARNGDTANKIGTYMLAVLAHQHGIPFYIAAPHSTFDLSIASGADISIEERKGEEITSLWFRRPIAPAGCKTYNPAFDITPYKLITGIITEKGIIYPPFYRNIKSKIPSFKIPNKYQYQNPKI